MKTLKYYEVRGLSLPFCLACRCGCCFPLLLTILGMFLNVPTLFVSTGSVHKSSKLKIPPEVPHLFFNQYTFFLHVMVLLPNLQPHMCFDTVHHYHLPGRDGTNRSIISFRSGMRRCIILEHLH